MATRLSADYFPKVQISHFVYAALTWAVMTGIWLVANWRKLGTADPEGDG